MNTFFPQPTDGGTPVPTISIPSSHPTNATETALTPTPQTTTSPSPISRTTCGFFFYHSWLDDIADLPLDVQREVIFAVAKYAAFKTIPSDLSPAASVAFRFCKRIIDYDLSRRQENEKRSKRSPKSSARAATSNPSQPADSHPLAPSSYPSAPSPLSTPPSNPAQPSDSHSLAPSSQNSTSSPAPPPPSNPAQPADSHPLAPSSQISAETSRSAYNNLESRVENQESIIQNENSLKKKEEDFSFSQLSNSSTYHSAPSSKNSRPASLEEVATYWRTENLKSSAQEFFDYYQSTQWRNKQGELLRSWKLAAKNWERYFLTSILPLRQKAEAVSLSLQLCEENANTAAQERERQRKTLETNFDQWKRRAVSPEEGRRAYQLALEETGGDPQAAIELLKRKRF